MIDTEQLKIIAYAVELSLGVKNSVFSKCRGKPREALARQITAYVMHCGFSATLTDIGDALGRDRTTITHAITKIEDMRDDKDFDNYLDQFLDYCDTLLKIRNMGNLEFMERFK